MKLIIRLGIILLFHFNFCLALDIVSLDKKAEKMYSDKFQYVAYCYDETYDENKVLCPGYTSTYNLQDSKCTSEQKRLKGTGNPYFEFEKALLEDSVLIQNLVVIRKDLSSNWKNVRGLKVDLKVAHSKYQSKLENITKYICFDESRKNNPKFFCNCHYNLSVSGFFPEDKVNGFIDTIPSKDKNYRFQAKVDNCSSPYLSSYDQCMLQHNASFKFKDNKNDYYSTSEVLITYDIPSKLNKSYLKIGLQKNDSSEYLGTLETLNKMNYGKGELKLSLSNYNLTYGNVLQVTLDGETVLSFYIMEPMPVFTYFAIAFAVVAALFIPYIIYRKYNRKSELKGTRELEETTILDEKVTVYIGYHDDRKWFQDKVNCLAYSLKAKNGLDVKIAEWDLESELNRSCWVENIIKSCDKFVFIWSKQAALVFDMIENGEKLVTPPKAFISIAKQMKKDLLRFTYSKDKVVSAFLEPECEQEIPVWFKKLVGRHFELKKQEREMLNLLYNIRCPEEIETSGEENNFGIADIAILMPDELAEFEEKKLVVNPPDFTQEIDANELECLIKPTQNAITELRVCPPEM